MVAVRPQLVVGLGNPGAKHEAFRHNAGFWFADRLAARLGGEFRPSGRFPLELCECGPPPGGGGGAAGRVRIVKPTTFMNLSGQAVGPFAGYFRIEPEAILVVHDELDLPPGAVRLKEGGGHGGHNGLRDVAAHLGSNAFVRLRLGIGHPGRADDVIDYVLHRPRAEERRLIDDAMERALGVSGAILAGDLQRAMKVLHTKPDAGGGSGDPAAADGAGPGDGDTGTAAPTRPDSGGGNGPRTAAPAGAGPAG